MKADKTPGGHGSKVNYRLALTNLFARMAISAGFLSSVADRLGIWGPHGSRYASWGDFPHFLNYLAQVAPYLPTPLIPMAGWLATLAELVLGIGILIPGRITANVALGSGALMLLFAVFMSLGTGIKSALSYSAFAASAAAFLLFQKTRTSENSTPQDTAR